MLDESQNPISIHIKHYLTIISRGHVIINCKLFVNCIVLPLTVCRRGCTIVSPRRGYTTPTRTERGCKKMTNNNTNTPTRYAAFAYTVDYLTAAAADKDATKAERRAERAAKSAAAAERRADYAGTDTAADIARKARAAADVARTEAETARAAATIAAAAPGAFVVGFDLTADSPTDAHTAATLTVERMTARGIFPAAGAVRVYIDLRPALTAAAVTENARRALNAAKAAYTTDPTPERAATVSDARKALTAAERGQECAECAALNAAPEAVARQVAKRSTEREGTPKQWSIRRAAEARDAFDPDFSDMISAARVAMSAAIYGTTAAADEMEQTAAAVLTAAKDPDPVTRSTVTPADVANARADIRAAAVIRERAADPAAPFWIIGAYRAAFLSVNDHLTACRAIRTSERPAPLSIDDIDPADPAFIVEFDPEAERDAAERAAALRAAFVRVLSDATPTRRRVLTLAGRGYTVAQIAAKTNRHPSTIAEHLNAVRVPVAVELTDTAPDIAAALRAAAVIEQTAAAVDPQIIITRRATAAAVAAVAEQTAAALALSAAVDALTPVRREIWTHYRRGESVRGIARAIRRDESTIREHLRHIRADLAAAVEDTAPDLAAALRTANLAAVAAAVK